MMSCPHWKPLLAHRFDPSLDEPEDWSLALEHLETCEACRIEAYGADPSLLFQDLPEVEVSETEIRQMQLAVTTLRQGLELAERDSAHLLESGARRWSRSKIAASLAVAGGLLFGTLGFLRQGEDADPGTQIVAVAPEPGTAAPERLPEEALGERTSSPWNTSVPSSLPSALPASWKDAPVVEEVGGPLTRVYNYPTAPGDKIALVMVIDPTLDV